MGFGEDYWFEWRNWYATLTPKAQSQYRANHPEPHEWTGFYSRAAP
jgi:hypothetical protein